MLNLYEKVNVILIQKSELLHLCDGGQLMWAQSQGIMNDVYIQWYINKVSISLISQDLQLFIGVLVFTIIPSN